MAIYVTSDAHGHLRALDEVLEQASIGAHDELYVLGDMVDRGPDPLGVMRLVRSLPSAQVLMGNHEHMMLAAFARQGVEALAGFDLSGFAADAMLDWGCWMMNGGFATSDQLELLSDDEFDELLAWAANLRLFASVRAGETTFALVHAGIDPRGAAAWRADHPDADLDDPAQLDELLFAQSLEDLLWIRDGYWGVPTGLVDAAGKGPVVVGGHTPSVYLSRWSDGEELSCATKDGQGKVVWLGASEATGGVPDRVDIDCAAAAGAGMGRVGVMRLDDGATWYASIREGE